MILLWDEWNTQHIARHMVEQEEAAEVLSRARRPYPARVGDKYIVRGQSSAGRYLQVVYALRDPATIDVAEAPLEIRMAVDAEETIGYVIHARDLSGRERRSLVQRRRT